MRWSRALAVACFAMMVVSARLDEPRAAPAEGARRCLGERVTIEGTDAADVLVGTKGDDVIHAFGGSDKIRAGTGNDSICGGRGHDVMRGAEGIDFFDPGAGDDRVFGGREPINSIEYYRSPSGVFVDLEAGTARGWGHDRIRRVHQVVGSRHADLLAGDLRGNALIGMEGDDTLLGRRGHDSLMAGAGSDRLRGGSGNDYGVFRDSPRAVQVDLAKGTARGDGHDSLQQIEDLYGSPFDDALLGNGAGNDLLGGGGGDDTFFGRGGNDLILRYVGNGTVNGGRGTDAVYYQFAGTIDLTSGTAAGTDFSDAISRIESVFGGPGRHLVVGDALRNVLSGGGGRDVLRGGDGDDTVSGMAGADALFGGAGNDTLAGGSGEDTCLEGENVDGCETSSRSPRTAMAIGRARAAVTAALRANLIISMLHVR